MYKLYCDKSELSLGQLYLLKLCDKRKLSEFIRNELTDNFTLSFLMKLATGKYKYPSLRFIYATVNTIQPVDWFINKPELRKIVKNIDYTKEIEKSINYKKLKQIYDNKELLKYCKETFGEEAHNFYSKLNVIFSGRNSFSPVFIKELEPFYPIEDWFKK